MASKKLKPIQRRTETVPLFTNEDQDHLAELWDKIDTARATQATSPQREADAPVFEAAEEHDAFMVEALTRAEKVQITALPKKLWRKMLLDYPPRRDVTDAEGAVIESFPQDEEHGFNIELMSDPLVVASIDLDQFENEEARQEWVDELDDPKFSRIFSAAVRINERGTPDPKFSASSWIALTSAVMSRSAGPSAEGSTSSKGSPERVGSSSEPTG